MRINSVYFLILDRFKRLIKPKVPIFQILFFKLIKKNNSVTELNYLDSRYFITRLLDKTINNHLTSFEITSKNGTRLSHSFRNRYVVELSEVIVNTKNLDVFAIDKKLKSHLILDSTEWSQLPRTNVPDIRDLHGLDSKASLGFPSANYFHKITEYLPRVIKLASIYSHPFIFNSRLSNIDLELIKTLKIDFYQFPNFVKVNKLNMLSMENDLGYMHPDDLKLLKRFSNEIVPACNANKRIYLSRRYSRRSDINEKLLELMLINQGFAVVYAEQLTFLQQVQLFKSAATIVGIHGSGLVNLIWSESANLIELMPITRINRCFEWIAGLNNSKYARIDFNPKNYNLETIFRQICELIPRIKNS